MINMDKKKEVVDHKWGNRVVMVLLMCLLAVLLVTGVHVCKSHGEENKPAVNLVLQFETADGGILKGLIAHYLINDYSIEVRDNAKYTVIILNLKKVIWCGLLEGNRSYMFISGLVLSEDDQRYVKGGFATVCEWRPDANKRMGAKKAAEAIATIISRLSEGEGT